MDTPSPYAELVRRAVLDGIRARGSSVQAIAEAAGIPRVTLVRRLATVDGRTFTVSELEAIARALDVPVTSLTAPAAR